MKYTIAEMANKFNTSAKNYVYNRETEAKQKQEAETARYENALKILEENKPKFADVHLLTNSIYNYLNAKKSWAYSLGNTLVRSLDNTRFLNVGRDYFIYSCPDINSWTGESIHDVILIKYDDGTIHHTRIRDFYVGQEGDYANPINPKHVYPIENVQSFIETHKSDTSYANINCFSEAFEQIPDRIEALVKFAEAFSDLEDSNLEMAKYMATYRK